MLIYCNGCSATAGTIWSLKNSDLSLTYPNQLANKLSADLINKSYIGKSNYSICNETVRDLLTIDNKPDLVIIQWTYSERFVTPKMGKKGLVTHYPFASDIRSDPFISTHFDLKDFNGILELEDITLFYMITLEHFLKSLNIKFMMLDYGRSYMATNNLRLSYKKSLTHKSLLDKDNWLHDIDITIPMILDSYGFKKSKTLRPDGKPDGHYMDDAHEFLCEAVLDFYHLGKKLNTKDFKYKEDPSHFYVGEF